MGYKAIESELTEGVQRIVLNRPNVMNSMNAEMATELIQVFQAARENPQARVVLISANGKGFCAGQDLAEVTGDNAPENLSEYVATRYNPLVRLIRETEKPFICAVNGIAAGAGANFAFCCDLVLAAESATFVQAFSKIGLVPDTGGTFFLPKLIGLARATRLMFLNEKLTAQEAESWGLIYKAVPEAALQSEALTLAKKLAMEPTRSFGMIKRALNESFSSTLQQQLLLEQDLQGIAGCTEDYQEGVAAFLEKRSPQFKGQ